MRTFGIFAIVCVTICLVQGFPVDGEDKMGKHSHGRGYHGMMSRECMGVNVTMTEDNKSKLQSCFKPMDQTAHQEGKDKLTEDERKEHINKYRSCGLVCRGQALGLFDASGQPVKDQIDAFNKVFFPAAAISEINTAMTDCIDKHSSGLVLKEGDCSSYNDLEDCLHKSIKKVCHPDKATV